MAAGRGCREAISCEVGRPSAKQAEIARPTRELELNRRKLRKSESSQRIIIDCDAKTLDFPEAAWIAT